MRQQCPICKRTPNLLYILNIVLCYRGGGGHAFSNLCKHPTDSDLRNFA
jgi:hypothetical protein